jgi:zinc and cadmium transporter
MDPLLLLQTGLTPGSDPVRNVEALAWILGGGVVMSVIALVGVVAVFLPERILERVLLPTVAFAAGSLLGGAMFHLIPGAMGGMAPHPLFLWVLLGFTAFFVLEQFLHWHRSHSASPRPERPEAYLILLGDGLHNLLGGLAVGAAFIVDIRVGISAWIAAAAHEVPQELGDFAILVHGGFEKGRALLFNFVSALTFPVAGVAAWILAELADLDVLFLLPFAAGQFLYIAASDLVPEIKADHGPGRNLVHLGCFVLGAGLLWGLAVGLG